MIHYSAANQKESAVDVVQSPERLQARLEELAGGVERERGLVSEAERRSRDLQARMDTIAKVSACLPTPLPPAEPLQKEGWATRSKPPSMRSASHAKTVITGT